MTFEVVQIGDATLIFGDNLAYMRAEKPRIDALIADIPYKMKTSGGGEFRKSRTYLDEIKANGTADGFDIEVFHYAMRLGCNSLVTFYSLDQEPSILRFFHQGLFDKQKPLYFEHQQPIPWQKTNPTPFCNRAYNADVEYIRHGWRAPFKLKQRPLKDMKTWWSNGNGKSEFDHPSVKPILLMRKLVRNASHRGQLVIDPCMGTGSTGVACIQLGRKFIGIEHNRAYFDIAVERLQAAYAEMSGVVA
ncbi:MAG: site-specific DNA-methyltransferase [Rhizobiales bacterium]|nr:site-specific DNA-methyltransferase [Hyphomicrobiales bacterium]NRB15026.1 site-specific DNA-methyltransferase [Hyphomicrobiales bacterium]